VDRLDDGLGRRGVAEEFAGVGDGVAEGGDGDGAAVPDGFEDLLLGDWAVAVADEEQDEVEDLAGEMDRGAAAGEAEAQRVDLEVEEPVEHGAVRLVVSFSAAGSPSGRSSSSPG
jgi:hypothetical protein